MPLVDYQEIPFVAFSVSQLYLDILDSEGRRILKSISRDSWILLFHIGENLLTVSQYFDRNRYNTHQSPVFLFCNRSHLVLLCLFLVILFVSLREGIRKQGLWFVISVLSCVLTFHKDKIFTNWFGTHLVRMTHATVHCSPKALQLERGLPDF